MLKAELEEMVERLEADLKTANRTLDTIKDAHQKQLDRISEVAMTYAEENDLCDEVENALMDAGLEVPLTTQTITVSVSVNVTGPRLRAHSHRDLGEYLQDQVLADKEWVTKIFDPETVHKVEFRNSEYQHNGDLRIEVWD